MLIFVILNYERDTSDLGSVQWRILGGGNSVGAGGDPKGAEYGRN